MAELKADNGLIKDLNAAQSYEDIRALLESATVRSGIAERDPETGRFVTRNAAPTQDATESSEPREFKKTATIAGQEFEFTGSSLENVEAQILSAKSVAEQLQRDAAATETQRATRGDDALSAAEQAELQLQFRRGEIDAKTYLEKSGAVSDYFAKQGISIDDLKGTVEKQKSDQYVQDWESAGQEFLAHSDWPGGEKNRVILQNTLSVMGLMDAEDKVGALTKAYAKMKQDGTIFRVNESDEAVLKAAAKASPQEILEAYKQAQRDLSPEQQNDAFVRTFSSSGSGIFGK